MTKILISYSRKDSIIARKLIEEFKSLDLETWVDWEDIPPAVGWLEQIEQGIEQSDAFIFLISPDSVTSEVCKVEVEHARKNHKRIIPILVRDTDTKSVMSTVRDLNWIFIREQDDLKEALEKVRIAINLNLEWVEEHRRLQVRALDWDRKKDPSLLLRGGDLRSARHMLATAEKNDPKPSQLQLTYINYSIEDERRKTLLWVSAAAALIIMIILSMTAVDQWRQASANEKVAQEQRQLAQENESLALENARLANEAKVIAKAQRSAARAQIYQSRVGGLFTSTLLAIDSWQRTPSHEAEEILRKNISLLPIPVARFHQADTISALELNPLGGTFVSTSWDGTACVTNIEDGKNLYCVESSGPVEDAAYSPDGRIIVTGDEIGTVLFIDAENGMVLDRREYKVPVWDVNISPNGESLAIARDDGYITILNLATRELDYELVTNGSLYAISFSPNGEWMAAGTNIGTITLWNLKTGKIISGSSHKGEVYDIAFSPDSTKLLSGGADNVAILIQASTGAELFRSINEDWVEDVTFSPDGAWFVTASDDYRIRVWDARTGREKLRMLQDSYVSEVKVSPNGQWIASTGYDHTARVWSSATGAEVYQIPLSGTGNTITFSNDGNYLIAGEQEGEIGIWNISSLSISQSYLQFDGAVGNVQFSPSGEWLAASSGGNLWLLNPAQLPTLTAPPGLPVVSLIEDVIAQLVVSPDSKWIAFTTTEGKVILYNTISQTRKTLFTSTLELELAFSADGQSLIVGDSDGTVQSWNVETSEAVELLKAGSKVESLAVHSDHLVVGLLDRLIVLDPGAGKRGLEIQSFGDHQLMAFSADGRLLASNNSQGQIYIWQVADGEFALLHNIPSEHAYSLLFSPQGDRLFIGVANNVYVLDPFSGSEIDRIRQKDFVNTMSFSADGNTLATGSLRAVQFWNMQGIMSMGDIKIDDLACTRLTHNFDAAQWTSFFEEEPYRTLCEELPVP
jgi:WD40 repeat protein